MGHPSEYPIFTTEPAEHRRAIGIRCSACDDVQKLATNPRLPAEALASFARAKGWLIAHAMGSAMCPGCHVGDREAARAEAEARAERAAREHAELVAATRTELEHVHALIDKCREQQAALGELLSELTVEVHDLQGRADALQARLDASPRRLALVGGGS